MPAHPRSRGENSAPATAIRRPSGSSPLTRGKLRHDMVVPVRRSAHPRSRGENSAPATAIRRPSGSSPLTRGKLGDAGARALLAGLIPAHAGKTAAQCPDCRRTPAHPRSRGENGLDLTEVFTGGGSSPLTRGKHLATDTLPWDGGLIPAHAGKTRRWCRQLATPRAHPRSRGENQAFDPTADGDDGSSPLTRGKQRPGKRPSVVYRLIPAHAGKTAAK